MMKKLRLIVLVLAVFILVPQIASFMVRTTSGSAFEVDGFAEASTHAQTGYDIVFTYSERTWSHEDFQPNRLGIYHAASGEVEPFYTDESAIFVRSLAWSPSGQYLAILKTFYTGNPARTQICLLTRAGAEFRCFNDAPPPDYSSTSFLELNQVTWSDNEELIYFISEADGQRRLVELDIASGARQRILFETAAIQPNSMEGIWPTTFAWSPSLEYLILGVLENQPYSALINLESGEEKDLAAIVQPLGEQIRHSVPNTGYICQNFSSHNQYMLAVEYPQGEGSDKLIGFSADFETLFVIEDYPQEVYGDISECPLWSADESLLYFYVRDFKTSKRYFAAYAWQEQVYRSFEPFSLPVYSDRISISPDETSMTSVFHTGASVVVMIMPLGGGEIVEIAPQWEYSAYPLWIP